jgi:hypothetical protein
MIYIVIFVLMAIAAFIGYDIGNIDIDDKDKKTPK